MTIPGKMVLFDLAAVKESVDTRLACGVKVGDQAPQSALYGFPDVKLAVDLMVQDTAAARAALADYHQAVALLAKAGTGLGAALHTWDCSLDVAIAVSSKHCVNVDDAAGLGLPVMVDGARRYSFAMPLGLTAKIDITRNEIVSRVLKASGMRAAVTQMSADPYTATSWQDLEGYGLIQRIPMPPSGLYWLRAAHRRARVTSEYIAPVPIRVK